MTQRCTFTIGDFFFGVPVESIQEVLRGQRLTVVPLAPKEIRGLLNLRGDIVTVIDLRERLGLPPRPPQQTAVHVLVRDAGEVISLLVDRVGEVLALDESTFEPPPDTLRGAAQELVRGAYKLPDRLLLELNVERALEVTAP